VAELPLFPLRTVLFPGGLLPLRIFEARYVDMVGRCMREGVGFGVLRLNSGGEAGPAGELAAVGTEARIVDFSQLPEGLLGLMCRGTRRFRLLASRTQPDGLRIGDVEWLPEPPPVPLPPEHQGLVPVLQGVLAQLDELAQHLQPRWDDAGWVVDRLAEFLPLDRASQQHLLEIDDPLERLALLAPLVDTSAATGD
jgi:Lon protease-like protein